MHTICVDKPTRFMSHTLEDSASISILATGIFLFAPHLPTGEVVLGRLMRTWSRFVGSDVSKFVIDGITAL